MDFYITMALAVIFQVLKDRPARKKVYPALRKLYLSLHAVRVEFLLPSDTLSEGLSKGQET